MDKKTVRQFLADAAGYSKDARSMLRYKEPNVEAVLRRIDAARDMLDRAREALNVQVDS